MVKPPDAPAGKDLLMMYKDVTKLSLTYRNGTTLNLEGESLQNWIAFQGVLINIYTAMLATANLDKADKDPITRTLGDELTKNDRS